ncbi:3-keto-5-aminohexanoate cleavage protein [Papillibacter cinnamivorans]|uniref:Uncharacterized conserved protein, DUF849 family n=1 Tax=Papillibacter cinnamivorans DSM 12816 TaxID=1122930 RepID=A0A1W2BU97_9FIRM|nr:3-keto-5-aminohexanoate cleavage protein [Papillibacter cinnamivorans]SMC76461.1 Uncharacterized conserved protein, DUF849 family [Papillibacter cinnamivorans DSM 12816]
MADKRIITAALTGAMSPKKVNPNVPVTPEEIAEDAYKCWKAGAAMVHLHMRDENDKPTCDIAKFEETQHLIQKKCNIIINMTSTGDSDDDKRMAHIIKLKPEFCSYDSGTFNWMANPPWVFYNTPEFLTKLNKVCLDYNIRPEIEIFNGGMISVAEYYIERGELKTPCHFQFVLGVKGGLAPTVENLVHLRNLLPPGSTWSAFGISAASMPMMYAILALGGHVRVGLEDSGFYTKGVMANNEMLVTRAARVIREMGAEVATPDEARKMLSITR